MGIDVAFTSADKDANSNLKVALPLAEAQAGFALLAGLLGRTGDPAGLLAQAIRTSTQGRVQTGQPIPMLNEFFSNTTLNSALFQAPVTTMTVTCAGGTLNINASAITTLSTVARVATYAFFPLFADLSIYATCDAFMTAAPQTNCTVEMGFFQATGTSAPTDGCFFRWDATGNFKAVMNTNGTEVTSSALTAPSINVSHKFKIVVENDRALYYIDGALQAVIPGPAALGAPIYQSSVPWAARVYNAATGPATAMVLKIAYLYIGIEDAMGLNKDNAVIAAFQGRMGSQGQTGHTMGSTALYTNSLAAGAGAAATNTTAALGSGLGGQFAVQPTLAAGTDGIISSYQNPAATSAIPGKTLYIRGVRIHGLVTAALTGGPVLYAYSLAYGHTAVSLATSEAATTKAPRRVPLGYETYVVTAAVGAVGNGVDVKFSAPIAVNPGEFVQLVAKNQGTVTSAGVIALLVMFDSYWE